MKIEKFIGLSLAAAFLISAAKKVLPKRSHRNETHMSTPNADQNTLELGAEASVINLDDLDFVYAPTLVNKARSNSIEEALEGNLRADAFIVKESKESDLWSYIETGVSLSKRTAGGFTLDEALLLLEDFARNNEDVVHGIHSTEVTRASFDIAYDSAYEKYGSASLQDVLRARGVDPEKIDLLRKANNIKAIIKGYERPEYGGPK